MYNKVNLEQCFAVTSPKRVVVIQASLKIVRKETLVQLSKNDNTIQYPRDQNVYMLNTALQNDALT